jgi:hypothetical protein
MLIWLNGPFGGGKTQTAYELRRRLTGAVVVDPELVGFGLQHAIPHGLRPDFQDLASWRTGVVEVLDHTLRHHEGPVIAPMTLVVPAYFEEIVGAYAASARTYATSAWSRPPMSYGGACASAPSADCARGERCGRSSRSTAVPRRCSVRSSPSTSTPRGTA